MATLTILSGPTGPLTIVRVPLPRGRQPERLFYGCHDFMKTMTEQLPEWKSGRLGAALAPRQQMDDILRKWIGGYEIIYGRMFQDLMPGKDEVWELKTADLRIFGWVPRPKVFIAGVLGYADDFKPAKPGQTPKKSYEDARKAILAIRDKLDLDPPKFATGEYDALI